MIRSSCLRQARLISSRSLFGLSPVARLTRCVPSSISKNSYGLSLCLVRKASSSPNTNTKATPKIAAESKTKDLKPVSNPRILVYHAGTPRIMFLGILKVTTAFVFGFFAVVTIPTFVQAGAPLWQTAGLAVASVIPLLTVWYLTYPMVMWMHIAIPNNCVKNPSELQRFINNIPTTTEVAITTMGPLANARISKATLAELRPFNRRFGLVNYVRDVTRENAEREWYQFRAAGEFKIEDGVVDKITRKPWPWYQIQRVITERNASKARAPKQKIILLHGLRQNTAAKDTPPRRGQPLNPLRGKPVQAGHKKFETKKKW
ncbi:unnamed protein product [Discula destructiva]